MHPQAIFIDGSNDEEAFLTRGVIRHVKLSKTTLIKLPGRAGKTLDWITKVDSAALRCKAPESESNLYTQSLMNYSVG